MNKRILFVDDENNVLQGYRRSLRNYFDVSIANSGKLGLELIQNEEPFAVVISDFRMPEMDGIEFLHNVKQHSPDTVRIILTGFADLQLAIDAINEGNIFRFLTKPIQNDKLVGSINEAVELHRLVTTEKELNRKLNEAYSTIRKDLETAAELQRQFLPDSGISINDCTFDWIFIPSVFVSGDTFNYFPLDDSKIAFYIVDVSGHGLPAAFLSVSLSRSLGSGFNNQLLSANGDGTEFYEPSKVVKLLNERFLSKGKNAEYFTMLYGIIDLNEDKITFAQAGHPFPIYIKSGSKPEYLVSRGFPVGILPEADYFDQVVSFKPGDRFSIYTDGITECAGIKKKNQIQAQLIDFLAANSNLKPKNLLAQINNQLKEWTAESDYVDDITMLVIERQK